MIKLLLLTVFYVWPFGQLLAFTTPLIPFTVYLLDIVVFLLFLSLVFSKERKIIFNTPVTQPLLIFLGIVFFSFVVNIKQVINSGILLSSLYLLRLIIYPSIFFATRHFGLKYVKKPILISVVIFCLLGIMQYLIFPDMRYLKNIGFDDHYYRLIGSFYDPNFTGAILSGLALYFVCKNKFLVSLPFIILLALTFSRASYFVFVIGAIYLLLRHKRIKLLLLLGLLGIAIYFIPKPFGEGVNLLRTFSIISRIDSWQQGMYLFSEKPVFGWGYNALRSANGTRFSIDNSFILILATTGILGFIALLHLLRKFNHYTTDEATKVFVFSLLIHSFFNNSLLYIWIFTAFWVALGLGQAKIREYKSDE